MADEIQPITDPPRRLSEAELKTLAVDLVEDKVFITNSAEGMRNSFGMVLMLIDLRPIAEEVGAFYEYWSKAGPRSINGFPFFTSMNMLHREDLPLLLESVDAYEKHRKSFAGEGVES